MTANSMLLALLLALLPSAAAGSVPRVLEEPLKVAATVPSLGSLARAVGGDLVEVTVFAKGSEDAHFVEPRPSFVRMLHSADLLVLVGMELESAWLPPLLRGARNAAVQPGAPGYLDASAGLAPLNVPTGTVDRSQGDVHPLGNPHYLLDPLQGLRVAGLLADRLGQLRPAQRERFAEGLRRFERSLAARLVGESLVEQHGPQVAFQMARLHEKGGLARVLDEQKVNVQGWLGATLEWPGTEVAADHEMWPYFCHRFGLLVVAHLEPKPGLPPTSRHLAEVVKTLRTDDVPALLTATYFNVRSAQFVADHSAAVVVPLAHEVGARPGTDDYLAMIDHNVMSLAAALRREGA